MKTGGSQEGWAVSTMGEEDMEELVRTVEGELVLGHGREGHG